MYKSITKLTDEQKTELTSGFLKKLGERLKLKRNILNLSQEELADCLDIDRSTLSKYENGDRDMDVSMLPLFSTYCKFPIYELFPKDESQAILNTFSKAIIITVERKERQERLHLKKADREMISMQGRSKILKAQIYDVDGQDVYEPVPQKTKAVSLREKYKNAEMHTEYEAYSDDEFYNYVKEQKGKIAGSVIAAGEFLNQIENLPNKETLKGAVADYLLDELIINDVAKEHPDEVSKRAYAYYQRLYQLFKDRAKGMDNGSEPPLND